MMVFPVYILIGGLLDILSTYVGLQLGFVESSQLFMLMPFAWMLILMAMAFIIYHFRWAPQFVRKTLILGLVLYSFVPGLHNLAVIWRVY